MYIICNNNKRMCLSAELYFKGMEEMKDYDYDWTERDVEDMRQTISYLRQKLKSNPKLNFKDSPYVKMIEHRLDKIKSYMKKKHDNKRFLVDYVTEFCRSNDIIYAKDINECIDKFNKKYGFRIIRIQDLEFTLN